MSYKLQKGLLILFVALAYVLLLGGMMLINTGCVDRTPVNYRVYVLDKWQDTTQYTTTSFMRCGQTTIPMVHYHKRINNHVKFMFWNLENPTSPIGNNVYIEETSDVYYKLLEKNKTYFFTEENEYELRLRNKEKSYNNKIQ